MKYLGIAALALASSLILNSQSAEARPVSYPGGWTVMQMNDGDMSSLHVHYSPTFQDSIGFYTERNWGKDWQFTGLQYNRLVKRWNGDKSQANIYFKAAAGHTENLETGQQDLGGFLGVSADWETRRWFASYEARGHNMGFTKHAHQSARVGIAPYIGDYGDLHTWLMLQVNNDPTADTPTKVTPLVRFFYDVQLLEIGYTPEDDELMLNWIIRF